MPLVPMKGKCHATAYKDLVDHCVFLDLCLGKTLGQIVSLTNELLGNLVRGRVSNHTA